MKRFVVSLTVLLSLNVMYAQDITLPAPNKEGGKPLMEVFNNRRSTREMSDKPLSQQTLSDLLWAAAGVNRPDGRRTAPSAMNMQEIDIYVYTPKAVYLYIPQEHILRHLLTGDFRAEIARQPFAQKAPVVLLYVANYERMTRLDQQQKDFYGATDTGFISQNRCAGHDRQGSGQKQARIRWQSTVGTACGLSQTRLNGKILTTGVYEKSIINCFMSLVRFMEL